MTSIPRKHGLEAVYHTYLPNRIRRYLNERGIPDAIIEAHLIGWNGKRITLPIFNRDGAFTFFKLAKDPDDRSASPKMLCTPGAQAELYGWERVLAHPTEIIICEGEFDRLVLEAKGFQAVTSTAGAGTFRKEWASECGCFCITPRKGIFQGLPLQGLISDFSVNC